MTCMNPESGRPITPAGSRRSGTRQMRDPPGVRCADTRQLDSTLSMWGGVPEAADASAAGWPRDLHEVAEMRADLLQLLADVRQLAGDPLVGAGLGSLIITHDHDRARARRARSSRERARATPPSRTTPHNRPRCWFLSRAYGHFRATAPQVRHIMTPICAVTLCSTIRSPTMTP